MERCSTLEEVCARKSAIVKQVLPRDMQGERLARMAAESRRTPRGRIMYAWTCTACPVSNSFTVPLIRYILEHHVADPKLLQRVQYSDESQSRRRWTGVRYRQHSEVSAQQCLGTACLLLE